MPQTSTLDMFCVKANPFTQTVRRTLLILTYSIVAILVSAQTSNVNIFGLQSVNCGDSIIYRVTITNVDPPNGNPLTNTSVTMEFLTEAMALIGTRTLNGPNIAPGAMHVFDMPLYGDDLGTNGMYFARFTFNAAVDMNNDNVSPPFPVTARRCCGDFNAALIDSLIPCFGASTGALEVSASGGTLPYFYNWSTGANTARIEGISSGTYSVTVTDLAQCSKVIEVTLNSYPELNVTVSKTDETAPGANDGTASVAVSGGSPPNSYMWSDGSGEPQRTGLPPGMYTVTVTDANECTAVRSVTINAFQCQLTVDVTGPMMDSVFASPMGGDPPYMYDWNTGDNTQAILYGGPGSYVVTVTDNAGCTAIDSIAVNCMISVDLFGPDSLCAGARDTLGVTVMGGRAPFAFDWSSGATDSLIVAQSGMNYAVTVTDADGCTADAITSIGVFPAIIIDTVEIVHATGGLSNGSIDVEISGGEPPFVVAWFVDTTIVSTSVDLENAPAGDYCLVVRDGNGCLAKTDTLTIEVSLGLVKPVPVGSIYPNPANESITIDLPGTWHLSITTISGQVVSSTRGVDKGSVPTGYLPIGMYIISVLQDNIVQSGKLLIAR